MRNLLVILLAMMGFALTACNTVKGAGQDISAAGGAVSEAADETEDDLTDGE